MSGKKMMVVCSSAALLVTGWLPVSVGTLTTLTVVGGGAALVTGCSSDRSDTRTEARTSERTEQRVEDRND